MRKNFPTQTAAGDNRGLTDRPFHCLSVGACYRTQLQECRPKKFRNVYLPMTVTRLRAGVETACEDRRSFEGLVVQGCPVGSAHRATNQEGDTTMVNATSGTPNTKKSNRRRQYVVNPDFQWKYTLGLSLAVFLVSSVLSSVLFVVLHEQARHRLMFPTSYVVDTGMVILMSALAFSILTATAVGWWGFMATHRICGPLFVLDRHFNEIAAGKIPKLRPLRRKDEFKALFKNFFSAVDTIRADKQSQFDSVCDALAALESAGCENDGVRRDAVENAVAQLNEMRNTLANALGVKADRNVAGGSTPSHTATPREPASVA